MTCEGHGVCRHNTGVEGIVAKPLRAAYKAGRVWAKLRHADTVDATVVGFTGTARHPKALAVRLPGGRIALSQRPTTALSSVVGPRLVPQAGRAFTKASESCTPAVGDVVVKVVAGTTGTPSTPCACADPREPSWSARPRRLRLLRTNPDFRTAVRRIAEEQAKEPSQKDVIGLHDGLDQAMRERIDEAVSAGILPASSKAAPLAESLGGLYGHAFERAGDGDLRRWLVARLQMTVDPHAKRYWQFLATINGWPASPTLAPVYTWFTTVLHGASAAAATS